MRSASLHIQSEIHRQFSILAAPHTYSNLSKNACVTIGVFLQPLPYLCRIVFVYWFSKGTLPLQTVTANTVMQVSGFKS